MGTGALSPLDSASLWIIIRAYLAPTREGEGSWSIHYFLTVRSLEDV